MFEIILIDDAAETALASSAIALRRPYARVAKMLEVEQAAAHLRSTDGSQPPETRLILLGPGALRRVHDGKLAAVASQDGTRLLLVGLASGLTPVERERALAAGVHAIYERPAGWPEYSALVHRILDSALNHNGH